MGKLETKQRKWRTYAKCAKQINRENKKRRKGVKQANREKQRNVAGESRKRDANSEKGRGIDKSTDKIDKNREPNAIHRGKNNILNKIFNILIYPLLIMNNK